MKNVYLKVVLAVFLFCLVQGIVSIVVSFCTGQTFNTQMLALALIGSGLLSCLILAGMKMIRLSGAFSCGHSPLKMSVIAYLAAVFGVFAMDLLGEKMDLPDMMGKEFLSMSHNLWGILALAVVGPITEELVFREGIQGFLQRKGVSCWTAIIISALCFGVIHFNPAQIPFAFGIGLILGIIYYKTGNVLLTSLIHITNNSMAVLEMRILGEDIETFSYEQALGGSLLSWVHIAVAAMVSVFLLCHYWKKA
jgi:membrane protease YdiL (CAAX protease family)